MHLLLARWRRQLIAVVLRVGSQRVIHIAATAVATD